MTVTSDFAVLVVARSNVVVRTRFYEEMATAGVDIEGLSSTHILRAAGEFVSRVESDAETARVNLGYAGFPSLAATLTSAPGWMHLHAKDFYEITVDAPIATRGKFRLTGNATVAQTTIATGDLIVRFGTSIAPVEFTNAEPFTPLRNDYVDVPMVAKVAGIKGNIANNATLSLVTAYPGLTATNPPLSGSATWITTRGKDQETLVSLLARTKARWADLSEGTSRERFARLVRQAFAAAGQSNSITKIYPDDTNPLGPGSVALYLATDSGAATTEQVAIVQCFIDSKHATAAQLALAAPTWELGQRWATGQGKFQVFPAAAASIAVTGPANLAAASDLADAALLSLATSYPIEGVTVYAEQIRTAIMNATGAQNVVLSAPTADTKTAPGTIVQFTPVTLTFTP